MGEVAGSLMNTSTTQMPSFEFDYPQRAIVATLYLLAAVVGTLGNSLVLLAVALSRRLRTPTIAFVVNLSLADLVTSLAIPWNAATLLSVDGLQPPQVGKWVCKVVTVVKVVAIGCSVYTLAMIGLNRLLLIIKPNAYRNWYSPRKIAAWLSVTWLVPLVVALLPPVLDVGDVGYVTLAHNCGFLDDHPHYAIYNLVITLTGYPVPLIIIVVSYVVIWRHIYLHSKKMRQHRDKSAEESTATGLAVVSNSSLAVGTGNTPESSSRTKTAVIRRAKSSNHQIEVTKNMFYIVCGFIICILPYIICLISQNGLIINYAIALLYFNSCINPMIYAAKHRDFKTIFGCILRRRWDDIPEPSGLLNAMKRIKCC